MEAVPKVHRHRHRRSNSRRHQERNNSSSNNSEMAAETITITTATATNIVAAEEGLAGSSSPPAAALVVAASRTRLTQENERQSSFEALDTTTECSISQQTVVLVNGHSLPEQEQQNVEQQQIEVAYDQATMSVETASIEVVCNTKESLEADTTKRSESPQPTANGSSRNSSGDAMSLRETLQQLQPTAIAATLSSSHHNHHQQRRRTSPSPARRSRADEPDTSTSYFHRGIIGFMDREIKSTNSSTFATPSPTPSVVAGGASKKLQSLSDPQASPALRSTRSRSSLDKSPRRKRSKSESRRRRERKLIAAGEMEVRQANETLMRYLKQCTDINDASLSGELEIDQNLDERRVHRKTKSQRDKRGHLISKLYTAGGLTSILKELSDDIVPADGEEIYNPFTPVVSPTDDAPAHIDKMFIQTSSGYRPVDHCYYKHSFVGASHGAAGGGVAGSSAGAGGGVGGGTGCQRNGSRGSLVGMRGSASYSDTRCLLDAQCRSSEITSNLHLACVVQRIWLLLSNICHGLLAGLALAHLLFVINTHPMGWSKIINDISLAGEASLTQQQQQSQEQYTTSESSAGYEAGNAGGTDADLTLHGAQSLVVIEDYGSFAAIYANTFYCLAIVCLVSVFDRMDICHLDLSNATELVSFRWIIIAMIYIATIILSICSNSIDDKLYFDKAANVTLTQQEMLGNQVLNIWNSLSVARSLGAIFGWIMIGLTPHDDLLYEHLLDMARYETNN